MLETRNVPPAAEPTHPGCQLFTTIYRILLEQTTVLDLHRIKFLFTDFSLHNEKYFKIYNHLTGVYFRSLLQLKIRFWGEVSLNPESFLYRGLSVFFCQVFSIAIVQHFSIAGLLHITHMIETDFMSAVMIFWIQPNGPQNTHNLCTEAKSSLKVKYC